MMRIIANLVWKEVRELLTLRTLTPFIAVLVIFLFIGRALRGERTKANAPQPVLVVVPDSSRFADTIIRRLKEENFSVTVTNVTKEQARKQAQQDGFSLLLVLPESLDYRIDRFQPVLIEAYAILKGFSFTQTMRSVKVKAAFARINSELTAYNLKRLIPDIPGENIQNPIQTSEFVILRDRMAAGSAEAVQGMALAQTFIIPLILLMVLLYASQTLAASIGQEKENKTLETLLTVPINRVTIVVGKMLGAVLVAVVFSLMFMLALGYYTTAFAEGVPSRTPDMSIALRLGLTLSPEAIFLLSVTLFLAIVTALALATLLALLSEDARGAQAALTPLMMLCLLPYFFTMFFNIQTLSLPLKILLFLIPFSYPFLIPQAILFGNYPLIIGGLVYMTIFSAVTIFIAARFFSSDLVLTTRLRFRRQR
ncbi:MAG: ABC transporter permease [candidate division WOR-3 bacterium]|jgi:ABC-2 type transport system permease protein|nr:ABC transporter permease [candidate division WOR-3 bacterium]MDH7519320.1 ABC transporter permease [bacterium]